MRRRTLTVMLLGALTIVAPAATASASEPALSLDAGRGTTLVVERDPFRIVLRAADGSEQVATLPGRQGAPVRVPGIDGPLPAEPVGAAGGFPALGWVVGVRAQQTVPFGLYAGNRLFGAEAGALVSVTGVRSVTRRAGGATLQLATDTPGVGPATLELTRLAGGGVELDLAPPRGLGAVSSMFSLASPPGEGLYGLGARKDAFDQRGTLRNVWVEQQNASDERAEPASCPTVGCDYTFPNGAQAAYYVQSALFGSGGWAAWVGNTELGRIDLAASRDDAVRWGVAAPRLRLSLAGGGLERASQSFTAVAGRAPAPPRWVYEPWIDVINEGEGEAAPNGSGFAGGARVRADLESIAQTSRRLDVPIGTLGVEGWHTVPGAEDFFPALRREGFHLSAYWNPFVAPSSAVYPEALAEGHLIEDPLGRPFPLITSRNTMAHAVDFTSPAARRWWRTQIDRSSRLGFEGFMHDFGEFVTEGMRFDNGRPPSEVHNAYPVHYHRAARAALEAFAAESPGFDPWFYVRAGYSGIGSEEGVAGATSGVFPGDETTDWAEGSGIPSVSPAMLNLALGGSYTFTTDVGGYLDFVAPRTTPELLTRWSQLAALTAVSRIHNSTAKGTLLPWDAGQELLDAYRRYAKLKVRLIDLVDRWSERAARDGVIGPVRPLVLDDDSPAARSIGDQWLLGSNILVAPVLEKGARSRRVYLPAGSRWERVTVGQDGGFVRTGDVEDGGRTVTAPAPLADIPLYRRVVRLSLSRRCTGGGRLRVVLRGREASVHRLELRIGARRVASISRPPLRRTLSRSTLARRGAATALRARAILDDGRVVRIARALPSCGVARRAG